MRIIKATDSIPVEHPVFMIFGQPGICKTSLAYSAKDPLLLDFDKGAHRAANRRDTLVIDTWTDIEELMATPEALEPYATLIPDTVGRTIDAIIGHLAKTQPKLAPGGNPTLQGWGTVKTMFRNWITALRALGKDVVLIAHDKEDKDGDTRIVRPDIAGGSYGEVFKVADFVGYLQMAGRNRVLDFNPTDRWVGKNPAGWEPFQVPPIAKATTFLAELVGKGREALGKLSEASAIIMREVETWRAQIAEYPDAAAFTKALGPLGEIKEPIAQTQVKKLLWDAAKAKGFEFDKEHKIFTAPEPVEA